MTGFFLAEQIIMHVCTDGIVITRGEHDIPVDKIRRGVGNLGNTGFLIKNTAIVCRIFTALFQKAAVFYLVAEENLQNEHSSMLF